MDALDMKLKFLNGKPIAIDGVMTYPITLDMISDIGYDEYRKLIGLLCASGEQLKPVGDVDNKEITDEEVFGYLIAYACCHEPTMKLLINGFKLACRNKVIFDRDTFRFIIGDGEINCNNFMRFQDVLRKRNGLENIEEDIDNPENEMARILLAKRKKLREKLKKSKKTDTEDDECGVTLSDLISILASGLKMSLFEVFKYDIYQFNDQFNRLRIFDEYEVNIQALLHGADSKKINLTHWISPIKENNG